MSLLGVRGYLLRGGEHLLVAEQVPLEREHYLFPPVEVGDRAVDPAALLRPAIDALWRDS